MGSTVITPSEIGGASKAIPPSRSIRRNRIMVGNLTQLGVVDNQRRRRLGYQPMTAPTTKQRVHDYIAEGLTVREIANLEAISTQAVYKHLKALEITPPTTPKTS